MDNIKIVKNVHKYDNSKICNKLDIIKYISKNQGILHRYIKNNDNNQYIYKFLYNLDKYNNLEICDWLDIYGKKLNQIIYNLIRNKNLPTHMLENINDSCLYGDFISLKILDDINTNINTSQNLKINYYNFNIDLTVNFKKKLFRKQIELFIKRCLILSILHNNSKNIYLDLWLTDNKKLIPKNYKILTQKEINSGLTSFGYMDTKTTIYRKEEINKLIIHELIHYLDLDFKYELEFNVSKYFNIKPDEFRIYESYTEINACIINCILCSYETTGKKNFNLFKKYLNYEIKFNLFQTAKILVFYGFEDIYEFIKPYDGKYKFKQNTSVFSYFFVKTALLFGIDEYFKFMEKCCNNFKFLNNEVNTKKFIELIIKTTKNQLFIKNLQIFMNYIREYKITKNILETLRMTCVEI
jgi:hypothetical protein